MEQMFFNTFKPLAAVWLLFAGSGMAAAQPNLTPLFNPFSGQVTVQNTSATFAAGTWLTIECDADRPEPPAGQIGPYRNPGFANKLSTTVPGLGVFQSHIHNLPFWSDLNFPAGMALFTVCVDAAGGLAESNERDNCIQVLRRQQAPKLKIGVPQPKLRLKH